MTTANTFDKEFSGLGQGAGHTGQIPTTTSTDGITAAAGGGQANAVLLTTGINRVTTVATVGDSVKLPPAVLGMLMVVSNAASNSMNLFPNSGGAINGGSPNAAIAVAGGKTAHLSCANTGQWHALISA